MITFEFHMQVHANLSLKSLIDNKSVLVQVIVLCWLCDKPLPKPMLAIWRLLAMVS